MNYAIRFRRCQILQPSKKERKLEIDMIETKSILIRLQQEGSEDYCLLILLLSPPIYWLLTCSGIGYLKCCAWLDWSDVSITAYIENLYNNIDCMSIWSAVCVVFLLQKKQKYNVHDPCSDWEMMPISIGRFALRQTHY